MVKVWGYGANDAGGNAESRGRGRGAKHKSSYSYPCYTIALGNAGELIVVPGL
jgi:hypothetical protein